MGDNGRTNAGFLSDVAGGKIEQIKWLLETRERTKLLNARDTAGRGCVHEAAKHGHTALVHAFYAHGADVEAPDRFGRTPLHCACEHGQLDTVRALLDAGCKAQIEDKTGRTALHLAACCNDPRIVQLLVGRQPALVRHADVHARTPLFYAVLNVHEEGATKQIIDYLLQQLAEPNAKDTYGRVALHYAAEEKMRSAVQLLLQYKADANIEDGVNGRTPLELAKSDHVRRVLKSAMDARSRRKRDSEHSAEGDAEAGGGPSGRRSLSPATRSVGSKQRDAAPPRSPQSMPLRPVPAALHAASFQDIQTRFIRIMERVQSGGLDQMEHVKRSHLFTGSWMKDISSHQQLLGNALKYVPGPEVCMRVFNLLRPPDRIPALRGDEKDILSYYETEQQSAPELWGGTDPYNATIPDVEDDSGFTYARRVELMRVIHDLRKELDAKDAQLEELRRNASRLEARLAGSMDSQTAEIIKSQASKAQLQALERGKEVEELRGHQAMLDGQLIYLKEQLGEESKKNLELDNELASVKEKLSNEQRKHGEHLGKHDKLNKDCEVRATELLLCQQKLRDAESIRDNALSELDAAKNDVASKDKALKELEAKHEEEKDAHRARVSAHAAHMENLTERHKQEQLQAVEGSKRIINELRIQLDKAVSEAKASDEHAKDLQNLYAVAPNVAQVFLNLGAYAPHTVDSSPGVMAQSEIGKEQLKS